MPSNDVVDMCLQILQIKVRSIAIVVCTRQIMLTGSKRLVLQVGKLKDLRHCGRQYRA